jgi:hypothetical protein
MDFIDKVLVDIGNDMRTLSKMNGALFEQWQDVKSEQFGQQFTSLIDEYWRLYSRTAAQRSTILQSIERNMEEMAQELHNDAVNAQRRDVDIK